VVERDLARDFTYGFTLLLIRGFYPRSPYDDFVDIPEAFFLKDVAYDSDLIDVPPVRAYDGRSDAKAVVAPGNELALARKRQREDIPVK
jgi:hypothetical protein